MQIFAKLNYKFIIIWYNKVYMLLIDNLGHACFKFVDEKCSIIFDPYKGIDGLEMPKVMANYLYVSHEHFDHSARENVELLPTESRMNIGSILVPHDHHNGAKRGMNKIHIFEMGGYRIAHFGDLGCIPNREILNELMNLDIILAPINGFYTISAEELVEIVNIIKPRLVIPMHYYRKENNSGLKDDGQIEIFKKLIDYKEVNTPSVVIDEKLFDKPALIFNKSEGDIL